MIAPLDESFARKLGAAWLEARGHDPDAKNVCGDPLIDTVMEDRTPERIRRAVIATCGVDIAALPGLTVRAAAWQPNPDRPELGPWTYTMYGPRSTNLGISLEAVVPTTPEGHPPAPEGFPSVPDEHPEAFELRALADLARFLCRHIRQRCAPSATETEPGRR